jgi:hypothetical protein
MWTDQFPAGYASRFRLASRSRQLLSRGNDMPVWALADVRQEPQCLLVSWSVFEVQLVRDGPVTRHVVGELGYGGEGRVSSAVREFDPARACFLTNSGRLYQVTGALGPGVEADYVWQSWLQRNPSFIEPNEVTSEVSQAIADAAGVASYSELRRQRLSRKSNLPR